MDLRTALKTSLPLVREKAKHRHYDRVCELAAKYYRPLVTGEGAQALIQQFNLREDEDAYKQRLRLTQVVTPSVCNTLLGPLRKIPKVKPMVDRVRTRVAGRDMKELPFYSSDSSKQRTCSGGSGVMARV